MSLILLTNDDGVKALGLKCLQECLNGVGELVVVAPDRERSAVSHGLTIHSPLKHTKISRTYYALNGTPADCILYSLNHLLEQPPDMVISGINHGANLGDDIMYSGTVAAAREASRHGIPALAISQAYSDRPIQFREGAKFARSLVEMMLFQKSDGGFCLNVNIPVREILGVRITRQGCSSHFPHFNVLDRRARKFFGTNYEGRKKSKLMLDFRAISDGYISITPLQRDQTDYSSVRSLLRYASRLFPES